MSSCNRRQNGRLRQFLLPRGDKQAAFYHLSFQEFLAAKAVSGLPDAEQHKLLLPKKKTARKKATAESMATQQREISVSEFFAKNRHLLGFDNPQKALLTAVREAVDNSLDACEEAGILPDLRIEIAEISENRYRVAVQDNGPGFPRELIGQLFEQHVVIGSDPHSDSHQIDSFASPLTDLDRFLNRLLDSQSFGTNVGGDLADYLAEAAALLAVPPAPAAPPRSESAGPRRR